MSGANLVGGALRLPVVSLKLQIQISLETSPRGQQRVGLKPWDGEGQSRSAFLPQEVDSDIEEV
jgi:hypothetical protein